MHELGHELDTDLGVTVRLDVDLRKALRADFADLGPYERCALSYFRDPEEAFAEFFAERYTGEKDPKLHLDHLRRARRVVNQELDRLERCQGTP